MKKNMGLADRVIRLVVAAGIIVLHQIGIITGTLAIILLIFAAIFVLTSVFSICPLYYPFGISTNKKKNIKNLNL